MEELLVTYPDGSHKKFSLSKGELLIGRDSDNDVVLPSPAVSRRHARIYMWDSQVFIEDLGSSNGIYVQGKRINEAALVKPGEPINIGEFTLNVIYSDEEETDGKPPRFYLKGRMPPFKDEIIPLEEDEIFVGRIDENHIVITHNSVSRRHSVIKIDSSQELVKISDLESSNGTFVDGKRIKEAILQNGNIIRFGDVEFEFIDTLAPKTRVKKELKLGGLTFSKNMVIAVSIVFILLFIMVVAGSLKKRAEQNKILNQMALNEKTQKPPIDSKLTELVEKVKQNIDKGDLASAKLYLRELLDMDPINDEGLKLKGRLENENKYRDMLESGDMKYSIGKLDEAKEMLSKIPTDSIYYESASQKLKDINTKLFNQIFSEMLKAKRQKRYKEAYDYIPRLAKINPSSSDLISEMRELERIMKQKKIKFTPIDLAQYSEKGSEVGTIKKDPFTLINPMYNDEEITKAVVYYYIGKPDNALLELSKLLKKKEYIKQKDRIEEIQLRIFKIKGKYREGQSAMLQGDIKQADSAFKEVLENDSKIVPTDPPSAFREDIEKQLIDVYIKIGFQNYNKGLYEDAFSSFLSAYKISPKHPDVLKAFSKLEKVAQEEYENLVISKTDIQSTIKKLNFIKSITLPSSDLYKLADQKLRSLK
ncbi:MAG: FHA domain-containing protein [Deltaproteobacteria bacterium]|nr:FHA domain-containing protein [Deltaproteobacteria bacterium]